MFTRLLCRRKWDSKNMTTLVRMAQPKKVYVFWSKFLGGSMWFWILWRLKHDWHELVGHDYVFSKMDAEGKH